MRKTFSWFMALFTGIVLLVTGCSNASQITFGDPSKDNFTKDGLAAVTINAGFGSNARDILPSDWVDGDKRNLLYVISGNDGSAGTLSETVFRYDEIASDDAVVNIIPSSTWNLTLDAYQVSKDNLLIKNYKADGKKVLTANNPTEDFTGGSRKVVFNLAPDYTNPDAKGRVDVTVNFFDEDKIKYAQFEVLNGLSTANVRTADDTVSVQAVLQDADLVAPTFDDLFSSGKEVEVIGGSSVTSPVKCATISKAGDGYSSITLNGELPAGKHTLKVTFYTVKNGSPTATNADDLIASQFYYEPITIDGGNVSKKTINIPKGVMNQAPKAPINLQTSVSLNAASDGSQVTLANGANAQKLGDAALGSIISTYLLKFTWTDTSSNETKFKLVLSNSDISDENSVEITDNGSKGITVTGKGTYTSEPDLSSAVGNISLSAGNLFAGSETVTIVVPTSLAFESAKIYAENEMTDKGEALSEAYQLKKAIGMKTVAYCLTSDKSGVTGKTATVTYSDGGTTTSPTDKYFVMGYEIKTPANKFMNTTSYPFVSLETAPGSEKYALSAWAKSTTYGAANDDSASTTLTNEPLTENILVFPRWTVNSMVNINFPNYSDYRDLSVLDGNASNPVVYRYDTQASSHSFTIKAYKGTGNDSDGNPVTKNYKFSVYGVNGTEIYKDSSSGPSTPSGISAAEETLTWDTTVPEFTGGVYRVNISFDYDPDGAAGNSLTHINKEPKNISGTVYVKIIR